MNAQVSRFTLQSRLGTCLSILVCFFILMGLLLHPVSIAHESKTANNQNSQKWELPDGAFVRLGKGVMGGSDRAIAFSPDGKHLAVASGIGIWIYDVETARELTLLNGGRAALIKSVAYTPDGTILAAGTGDGRVQLWEVESKRLLTEFIRPGPGYDVYGLAFSPDQRTVASGTRDEIQLWDVQNQRHLKTLQGHKGRIYSLAFSPDGASIASGAEDDTLKLWETATGKNLATIQHADDVLTVSFSPNGVTFATAANKNVQLWDISTKKNVATLKHTKQVKDVIFSPDGATLVSGSVNAVKLWDVKTKSVITTYKYGGNPGAVTFSPDSKILAAANTDRFGGTVKLWDVATGTNYATINGHIGTNNAIAFSPNEDAFAMTQAGGTVKFYEFTTGRHISTLSKEYVRSIAYSPDGNTLALGNYVDGSVKLTDIKSGRRLARLRGHADIVTIVAFSPDGTKLAVGARGGDQSSTDIVKIWRFPPKALDVLTQRSLKTLRVQAKWGVRIAFSPDSRTLAVGSDVGVSLLDVETGENIATLQKTPGAAAAFSPDGRMLASRSSDGTKLWDVSTSKIIMSSRREVEQSGSPVAFSPDGKMLALGTSRGKIVLLDVKTERNIATRHGHGEAVFSVVFSPDGNILASGSDDGTALLWKVSELIDD